MSRDSKPPAPARTPSGTAFTKVELKRVGIAEWIQTEQKLRNSELLRVLDDSCLEELLAAAVPRRFSPRSNVFDVGDSGTSLFLLLRGEVRQVVRVEAEPVEVAHVKPGEFFGEDVILNPGASRQSTAVALGEVDLAEFPRPQLERALAQQPMLKTELQRVHRLRQSAQAEMLAFIGRW